MSHLVRCACRSHCLTFNPETQSYEGEGELVSKSTAANHRRDDLTSRTLDPFTENAANQVLSYPPAAEPHDQRPPYPGFHDQRAAPPESYNQPFLDDFYSMLEAEAIYRCTWSPTNRSLVFATDPSPSLAYRYPSTSEIFTPNRGPYALHPGSIANAAYLENESRLCEILVALGRRSASNVRDRIIARVCEGLKMMERHKETEWNCQTAGSIARQHGYSVVDTGTHGIWFS